MTFELWLLFASLYLHAIFNSSISNWKAQFTHFKLKGPMLMAQGPELMALFVKLPNHPLLPRQNEVNSRSLILLPQQLVLKRDWTLFIRSLNRSGKMDMVELSNWKSEIYIVPAKLCQWISNCIWGNSTLQQQETFELWQQLRKNK